MLQNKHRFIIADSLRKSERDTTAMFRKGKEPWVLVPAVAVKLVVPADSALGHSVAEMRAKIEDAKKAKRPKKEKS